MLKHFSHLQSAPPVTPRHLLQILSKIFNGNAVKGCQRFSLNLGIVSQMPPFQILFHPLEQRKVATRKVGRVGGGWDTTIILILAPQE